MIIELFYAFKRIWSNTRRYNDFPSRMYSGDDHPSLDYDNVLKDEFFSGNNKNVLFEWIERANSIFELDYSIALKPEEVFAVCYAEVGLKGGYIDPKHDHKAGEWGLLPLISVLSHYTPHVNGMGAPNPFLLYHPEINVQEFILYLAGIRKHYIFENGFYNSPAIIGDELKFAHLTAAIVHGYFDPATYRDNPSNVVMPQPSEIVRHIGSGASLWDLMKNTTFRTAAKNAIPDRLVNIDRGIELAA